MMGAGPQSALANLKFAGHLPVMLNLGASVIEVIVENEFLFVEGQQLQTL